MNFESFFYKDGPFRLICVCQGEPTRMRSKERILAAQRKQGEGKQPVARVSCVCCGAFQRCSKSNLPTKSQIAFVPTHFSEKNKNLLHNFATLLWQLLMGKPKRRQIIQKRYVALTVHTFLVRVQIKLTQNKPFFLPGRSHEEGIIVCFQ